MKKMLNWMVAIITAIFGLGVVAAKDAPTSSRPTGEKPPPPSAIVVRDEAMEELKKIHRLNKQPNKH